MNRSLSVLIIEDNEEDAYFTVKQLRKGGFDVNYLRVDTETGMKSALQSDTWDLIVCDYSMPEFDLSTALALFRKEEKDIPFIIVSGAITEEKAVELIKEGINDYLLKDNLTRLIPIVERELREVAVRKELVMANRQLDRLNKYQVDAREDERAMISMEIHDELGQALTAIKLELNRLRENVQGSPGGMERIHSMLTMTNDMIKKVQRISSDLRPGLLDDLGLVSTIEWYCGEFSERSGVRCTLDLDDLPFELPDVSLALFRILQEALTNVIRHSGANSVNVALTFSDDVLRLSVEDNGCGTPWEKLESSNSLGLISMRQRARHCGGRIEFERCDGAGTRLFVIIPIRKSK
ncbi:MAG TPA: response regulator [Bacteroidales bacterium]|nr:response regulator [Bacteroidales bacterium]